MEGPEVNSGETHQYCWNCSVWRNGLKFLQADVNNWIKSYKFIRRSQQTLISKVTYFNHSYICNIRSFSSVNKCAGLIFCLLCINFVLFIKTIFFYHCGFSHHHCCSYKCNVLYLDVRVTKQAPTLFNNDTTTPKDFQTSTAWKTWIPALTPSSLLPLSNFA